MTAIYFYTLSLRLPYISCWRVCSFFNVYLCQKLDSYYMSLLWDLLLIGLIYMSLFVLPILIAMTPHKILSILKEILTKNSIFLLPYKFWDCFSVSVKNGPGILHWICRQLLIRWPFSHINSSNPWAFKVCVLVSSSLFF